MVGIYEVNNWGELFGKYEQLTSNKICPTCWSDKVKVYNFFKEKEMAKKTENTTGENYKFKKQFECYEVSIKGLGFVISKENLTNEIVEKHFKNEPSLMALIELV